MNPLEGLSLGAALIDDPVSKVGRGGSASGTRGTILVTVGLVYLRTS